MAGFPLCTFWYKEYIKLIRTLWRVYKEERRNTYTEETKQTKDIHPFWCSFPFLSFKSPFQGSRLCAPWMPHGLQVLPSGWRRLQSVWFSSVTRNWARTARTNQCALSTTPCSRGSTTSTSIASVSASCSRWPFCRYDALRMCCGFTYLFLHYGYNRYGFVCFFMMQHWTWGVSQWEQFPGFEHFCGCTRKLASIDLE